MKKLLFITLSLLTLMVSSCEKFADVAPPIDQLNTTTVFENDTTATQAIHGIYSEMMNNSSLFSAGNTTLYAGMAADELGYYTAGTPRDEFIANDLTLTSHNTLDVSFWTAPYKFIYSSNLILEKTLSSESLSPAVWRAVRGEAYFVRAFCYYYLVNLFGDVPLITSTDYTKNSTLPRSAIADVWSQITSDLEQAVSLLEPAYPTTERVRPNRFAALALQARVYLNLKNWAAAEAAASLVLASSQYALNANLDNSFLANSSEAIWQLRPVNGFQNTLEGSLIIPASATSVQTYFLRPELVNAFEAIDKRKVSWLRSRVYNAQTFFYPFKYRIRTGGVLTEYYTVLRVAETWLIRAEARARQNKFTEGAADLNMTRKRAGLAEIFPASQAALLNAIEQEKRLELFCEWGHRWFDLKRTERATAVLGSLKPASWQQTDSLWPIPQPQRDRNPSLTQNTGY